MKYVCLFLKSLIYLLSPMPGLKFQNQQNPCGTRKLCSVYPHSKGNISSSVSSQFPCSAAQKLLMRTPPDEWKHSQVLQPFKCLETSFILFILLRFLEESYTASPLGD